jgi:methylase of polypeptide subunit release factors
MYVAEVAREAVVPAEKIAEPTVGHESDVSFLLSPYTKQRVAVRLDPRMYSVKFEVEDNWVWHAFRGFALIAAKLEANGVRPETFAAVGSGSGIDAIGAANIFPSLKRIIVTDVEKTLARQAAANVRANVRSNLRVQGLAGDVCRPIAAASIDVLYTNLPNIPVAVADDTIIDHGSFYRPGPDLVTDDSLASYLLGLQYRFMLSAPKVLSRDGFALMMIGGRFPYAVFDQLARAAGFSFEEVLCCFKRQTEAENVVPSYAAAEKNGTEFDFYDFEAARKTLRGGEQLSGRQLKEALRPWRMSARDAEVQRRAGRAIGHTLHFMKATPLRP